MSTQAQPPAPLPSLQNQNQPQSVLDEPWKVTLIPAAAPAVDEPQARKSLPWRMGDVTRLKDDSPEGMMKYIATHSTGWWQEMAERALKDTEKARRMAEEQGWQPGQYWSLDVDAEAREKLLAAEEVRRAREAEERAKEEAEKEAFARRQMELLEKAGRAPRCEYQYTDGQGCKAPQVKGERWCHGHAKTMSYRPEKLEILPMEDEQAVMVNLYRVTKSLLSGRITEKVAGLMLWSIAIGAPGAGRNSPQRTRRTQRHGKQNIHRGGAETRRKAKKYLPQINTEKRRSSRRIGRESRNAGTQSTRRNTNNPGVTSDNSFRSGVTLESTPEIAEIARDRATSPTSENRNHKGHEGTQGRRRTASHSSVSPCLCGESSVNATKNTEERGRNSGDSISPVDNRQQAASNSVESRQEWFGKA